MIVTITLWLFQRSQLLLSMMAQLWPSPVQLGQDDEPFRLELQRRSTVQLKKSMKRRYRPQHTFTTYRVPGLLSLQAFYFWQGFISHGLERSAKLSWLKC